MDTIDTHILSLLKTNSRMTVSDISKQVNLSVPAVSERLRKLEDSGVIAQYTIQLNREKLDFHLLAIVFVNLDHTSSIPAFREKIITFSEVLECHHMAGEYDYMLKILTKNTKELEHFISHPLKSIQGVQRTNTLIALSTLKEEINP